MVKMDTTKATIIPTASKMASAEEKWKQMCIRDSYKCYNAAKVDDEKYPPIDGKEYCKIHWKALRCV